MIKSLDYFKSLVQEDDAIPLFEAGLLIAQNADPQLDLAAIQADVDTLAARLRQRLPSDVSSIQKLRMLNHFFYRDLGFACNTNDYYDPDNSYLHQVLRRRLGIPISLALIYIELANQIGLEVKGVAFPGHFLMKLSLQSGDIIIDPVNGASLSREELEEMLAPYFEKSFEQSEYPSARSIGHFLQTASARIILTRVLHNLKAIFGEARNWERLISVQNYLVALLPGDIAERRDRGMAYANYGHPQQALKDLEEYLEKCAGAPDAEQIRNTVAMLRESCKRPN